MNADFQDFKYKELTDRIIKIFYKAYNKLGYGFLEKVYENARMIELKREGIAAVAQSPINVLYDGKIIGEYFADVLVENKPYSCKKICRIIGGALHHLCQNAFSKSTEEFTWGEIFPPTPSLPLGGGREGWG